MKVLTDFHLINKIFRASYAFDSVFTSTANNGIVEIVLINNLGSKVLIFWNSGTKYDFKYEKRH